MVDESPLPGRVGAIQWTSRSRRGDGMLEAVPMER